MFCCHFEVSYLSLKKKPKIFQNFHFHAMDIGYGTVRVKEKDSLYFKLEEISWDKHSASGEDSLEEDGEKLCTMDMGGAPDITLLIKLQQRLKELENELQAEKLKQWSTQKDFRAEISRLQEVNERQQKLLSKYLKSSRAQTEAILQHEINRLTEENVDLREKNDSLSEQIKKSLKIDAKKLKETEGTEALPVMRLSTIQENLPFTKHKVEYMGMFEYREEDESIIIRRLVYDLKPKVAISLLPGLPSYILFMCIRYTDLINNDDKVRSLINNTAQGIQRVIKKHHDMEYTVLWLANTCRLLHNLKQYSGNTLFQFDNSPKQNDQCLRNFDLSEYRQIFSDIALWIYRRLMKIMKKNVEPLIVPALLEHEAIICIPGNKPYMHARPSRIAREMDSPIDPQNAVDILLKELSTFYEILILHRVDPELITQVFEQLFYSICAGALNNLLVRKDMCHWSIGMQIRYNLNHLEEWCRDKQIHQTEVTKTLEPIIQASQLLQAKKDEDHYAEGICGMCNKLTTPQIIKILNLYTPAGDLEERVPATLIRKIQSLLQEKDKQLGMQSTLLMDPKHSFPIIFPYNPSSICLEKLILPKVLNLCNVLKKL